MMKLSKNEPKNPEYPVYEDVTSLLKKIKQNAIYTAEDEFMDKKVVIESEYGTTGNIEPGFF